jgi:hypothetical protein
MMYKGFDISYIQPVVERQGIDNNGNVVSFRDSWHTGDGWYIAEREQPERIITSKQSLADIQIKIDALTEEKGND